MCQNNSAKVYSENITVCHAVLDRTMGLNPKVRTNFGVENFQPHSSVGYPMLCTIEPNYGVEPQSSYELWGRKFSTS